MKNFFTPRRAQLVRELIFDNCITANPANVVHCARLCPNLTSLSCLSCCVDPAGIVSLLIAPQSSLERLVWSLYPPDMYPARYTNVRQLLERSPESRALSLRYMYLEVARHDAIPERVVPAILERCSALDDLHLHAVQSEHHGSIERFGTLVGEDYIKQLRSFTYSLEEPTSRQLESPYSRLAGKNQPNAVFKIAAALLGNVVVHMQPGDKVNCVFLPDVVQTPAAIWGFTQLVLAIKDPNRSSAEQLAAAARLHCWSELRHLAITAVPPDSVCQLPILRTNFEAPLRNLFAVCRGITALNLTSLHFSISVNCCEIVAANLPMLQELAVAPCSINFECSVERLAAGCTRLEELDVRVSRDGASGFCKTCALPLNIQQSSMAVLQERTELKRLSFCDIQRMPSLEFLRASRLVSLRLFTVSWGEDTSYLGIGELLCSSPNLRSFTYGNAKLDLGCPEFLREMSLAKHLRILTLYSEVHADISVVRELFRRLTFAMPRLEVLHLHFAMLTGGEVPLTWLAHERGPGTSPDARGDTVGNRPCTFCYRSTFIGLASPRNRRDARF
ncbi:hypothetical protein V5799_013457 [Amblyomma americanum]|uniref:Uncharacterized protein n=1 Tax=Amblyomma americanum TaxID=6943 RepID=A0AAQ4E5W1_AMBAM